MNLNINPYKEFDDNLKISERVKSPLMTDRDNQVENLEVTNQTVQYNFSNRDTTAKKDSNIICDIREIVEHPKKDNDNKSKIPSDTGKKDLIKEDSKVNIGNFPKSPKNVSIIPKIYNKNYNSPRKDSINDQDKDMNNFTEYAQKVTCNGSEKESEFPIENRFNHRRKKSIAIPIRKSISKRQPDDKKKLEKDKIEEDGNKRTLNMEDLTPKDNNELNTKKDTNNKDKNKTKLKNNNNSKRKVSKSYGMKDV